MANLAATVRAYPLTPEPFQNLLSAFSQDVTKTRYPNRAELEDYCRRSANPVGRLVLTLFGVKSPQARAWSDSICTGLQLTNFWQDVGVDAQKERIYIPQDALAFHQISEVALFYSAAHGKTSPQWRKLMQEQVI